MARNGGYTLAKELGMVLKCGGAIGMLLVFATAAHAHPGYAGGEGFFGGGLAGGASHPLVGVDHLLAILAVGLLASSRRRAWALPAGFLLAMVAGGAVAAAGGSAGVLGRPAVEHLIAASVLVFGVLLIVSAPHSSWSGRFAAVLVPAFGLFHGYAHLVEAREVGSDAIFFGLGMALTTALLLAVGVGVGRRLIANRGPLESRRPAWPIRATGSVVAFCGVVMLVTSIGL